MNKPQKSTRYFRMGLSILISLCALYAVFYGSGPIQNWGMALIFATNYWLKQA
jgi:hypothetical protein